MKKDNILQGGYSHNFIPEINICHVKGTGVVNGEMTKIAMNSVVVDPQFTPKTQLIVDLTELDYHPSYHELMHLKDHLNFLKEYFQNEIAVVASGRFYHIANLISQMSIIKMKTFREYEQAQKWLQNCKQKRLN